MLHKDMVRLRGHYHSRRLTPSPPHWVPTQSGTLVRRPVHPGHSLGRQVPVHKTKLAGKVLLFCTTIGEMVVPVRVSYDGRLWTGNPSRGSFCGVDPA